MTDNIAGISFGHAGRFSVVTTHACEVAKSKSMLNIQSGLSTLVCNKFGQGRTNILNFSLQETYFKTWKNSNVMAQKQLRSLFSDILRDAKIRSHILSTNPDIEASVRANS